MTVPAQIPPATRPGIPVTWSYTPQNSGTYRCTSRRPPPLGRASGCRRTAADDYEFLSVNPLTKYIVLAVGLVIALLFLPFVVYIAARGLNRHGDPAAAARIGLFIGVLAFCGLAWYLFLRSPEYGAIGIAIEFIAAGASWSCCFPAGERCDGSQPIARNSRLPPGQKCLVVQCRLRNIIPLSNRMHIDWPA